MAVREGREEGACQRRGSMGQAAQPWVAWQRQRQAHVRTRGTQRAMQQQLLHDAQSASSGRGLHCHLPHGHAAQHGCTTDSMENGPGQLLVWTPLVIAVSELGLAAKVGKVNRCRGNRSAQSGNRSVSACGQSVLACRAAGRRRNCW